METYTILVAGKALVFTGPSISGVSQVVADLDCGIHDLSGTPIGWQKPSICIETIPAYSKTIGTTPGMGTRTTSPKPPVLPM